MEKDLNEITDQLEIINQRIKTAKKNKNISTIEVDIILDSLRKTYIIAEQLKANPISSFKKEEHIEIPVQPELKVEEKSSLVEMEVIPIMSFPEVIVQQVESPEIHTDLSEKTTSTSQDLIFEVESKQQFQPDTKAENVEPVRKYSDTNSNIDESSVHHSKTTSDLFGSPTISDKLKSEAPSLKDKITKGLHDQTLADKMQLKPIVDLKAAIGINDKFQFVNDLFEGHMDFYNDAIAQLNNCGSVNHAESIINTLRIKHNWKDDTESYEKLKSFVKRRYIQ